ERTTSRGAGELVAAALDAGATHVLLGLGGSATVDGGRDLAEALGWRFDGFDGHGHGGRIDGAGVHPGLRGARFTALCDVRVPLLGPHGAARAFAPQKGAGG